MSDQLNYDPFQKRDKVWSEHMGFGLFSTGYQYDHFVMHNNARKFDINEDGTLSGFESRVRIYYHAVADTDEGMREAIARGEGLKRPVPRGRWPIMPGDRVLNLTTGEVQKCGSDSSQTIFCFGHPYWNEGRFFSKENAPRIIRLYGGEEPPKTVAERLRFFANEMEKDGWEEKYGGGN